MLFKEGSLFIREVVRAEGRVMRNVEGRVGFPVGREKEGKRFRPATKSSGMTRQRRDGPDELHDLDIRGEVNRLDHLNEVPREESNYADVNDAEPEEGRSE